MANSMILKQFLIIEFDSIYELKVFDLDSLKGMVINARNDIQRRGNGGSIWLNTTDDGFENHAIGHTTIF